jgi:hypothetical protein
VNMFPRPRQNRNMEETCSVRSVPGLSQLTVEAVRGEKLIAEASSGTERKETVRR